MSTSLTRLLSMQAVRNLEALKRDAKRLKKRSLQVFGTDYPLSACQQAMAVSRGFKSFAHLEAVANQLGLNRHVPFWTILSRTDAHQAILNAIIQLDLDFAAGGPLVFVGQTQEAARPALILFLERISAMQKPGLILVESTAASIQDMPWFNAASALGVDETLLAFRVLDLRENILSLDESESEHESRSRPFLAVFSRDNPASESRAAVVHSHFTNHVDDSPPILYVSDGPGTYVPSLFMLEGHTVIVNGLVEFPSRQDLPAVDIYNRALKVLSTEKSLQFMGSKVLYASNERTA